MMNIHIILLGKLKEQYWRDAEAEYSKRLKPYAKLIITELKEESFRDGDSPDVVKKKEAEKINKALPEAGLVIALHERGREFTSVDFAKFLEQKSQSGQQITFVVGGPLGLHESVLERADMQISLSKLTFPHQMLRTIFLEQLYRAGTIVAGKRYNY